MAEYNLRKYIKNLPNQYNIGCCTSSATLLATEIMLNSIGRKEIFSRLFLYYMTRKLQDRVGKDGAELKSTLDAFTLYGVCLDRMWPFHINKVNVEPPTFAIEDAVNYKLKSYRQVDISEFKDFLHKETPIIIGMFTGKSFWKISGPLNRQVYKPINNTDNRRYRGHALTIVGYDDDLLGGSWIVANSTGLKWGDHGYGIVPYTCNIDIGESYVITELFGTPEIKISEF